jgi:hypothetical protein
MQAVISKGAKDDRIVFSRPDGSRAETRFPHKGTVPHDAVHYFVERNLAMERGFWGMIADGVHPEELLAIAKAAGHASASRCTAPDTSIVALVQAERIVECFEADLWTNAGTSDDLLALATVACASSYVPLPAMNSAHVAAIRTELQDFALAWIDVPVGGSIAFDWPPPLASAMWRVHDASMT